jgi:hypothetical protein
LELSRLVRNAVLQIVPPHTYKGHTLDVKGVGLETEKPSVGVGNRKGKKRKGKKKKKKKEKHPNLT